MIVIGADDPHKSQHTLVAVDAGSGQLLGELSVSSKPKGLRCLLDWARALSAERVFAVEDCRHVSGALERFLVARGERVVRVAPKLIAGARRAVRERGKSDAIDALAIARAYLREGPERLPVAFLDAEAMEIKLLRGSLPTAPTVAAPGAAIGACRLWALTDNGGYQPPQPNDLHIAFTRRRRSFARRSRLRPSMKAAASPVELFATELRPCRLDVDIPEVDPGRRPPPHATRWPSRELIADRSQGVQLATIQALARFWATEHD
jgi:hypothetical protein